MSADAGPEHGFPAFLQTLADCDKPIVTAVNGVGIGLGLTMLLHTDVNYIAAGARLRAPFVTLGVVPEAAASYLLPIVIGQQRAAEILFTARWIDAEESVALGLTFAVVPRRAALRYRARQGDGDRRQPAGGRAPHQTAAARLAPAGDRRGAPARGRGVPGTPGHTGEPRSDPRLLREARTS